MLAAFTAVSILPSNALAFESTLPHANSEALVARVYLKNRDSNLIPPNDALPVESYTRSASVVAVPSAETLEGEWEKVIRGARVAYVPDIESGKTGSGLVLEGEASYYSRAGCLGCDPLMIMANGQPLNDGALTMAIGANLKHLVGYKARVTYLPTGQSVEVLITDTGGFYQAKYGHRVADLTIAAKQAIGMQGGVGQVRVEIL